MTFTVRLTKRAEKDLAKIAKREGERIRIALRVLEKNPYPPATRKLVNRPEWRVRIGKYRIFYEVIDNEVVVLVIGIGLRWQIYDR
ncbi:MAG: type II toxin-antitoxin system RelE/ParE family toxin [Actinobacteria bacterium]|nr:type II toxin-antitoxin system RelE/ParE family toxin [Actinomycetota bacterium]NBY15547.1 type II toxin-antitoxin system RelE/ParE family toxin [Actinomycetota bacterium]